MPRSVSPGPSPLRLAAVVFALVALPACSLIGVDPQMTVREQARADSLARAQAVADSLNRAAREAALGRVLDRARASAAARRAEVRVEVTRRDSLARRARRRAFVADSLARVAFVADSLAAVAAAEAAERARARRGRVIGTGGASYYANRFAGRRTANGERYRPGRLTAAHRTLRFGTRVRVTNLRNGRSVVVRINDRGPFHRRRIIDLSRAAARRIGMIRSGTARVRLEVL